ncbi:hypothetical protein HKBW3C_01120, partial [Candidatus Hakubella thermalkaliphila]
MDIISVSRRTDIPAFYSEWFINRIRKGWVSFIHLYQRVIRNFRKMGLTFRDLEDNEKIELANRMAEVGKNYGITLYACCNDLLVDGQVRKAHCIDPEILLQITPHSIAHLKISPTRPQCGCLKSIDIGRYDSCPHGCLYCYANANKSIALKNYPYNVIYLNTYN